MTVDWVQVSDQDQEVLLRATEALEFERGGRVFRRLRVGEDDSVVPPPHPDPKAPRQG